MSRKLWIALALFSALIRANSAPPAAPADPLNRLNPRSAVTAFLEACHRDDYSKAAQYLDSSQIPAKQRAQEGSQLAKDLESVLNSATRFDVLRLSQDPQGNLSDDPDPAIEHVTTVSKDGQQFTIELQRHQLPNGPAIWQFSAKTVANLPQLMPPPSTESSIEAHLPRFLVTASLLETPLWKWIALVLVALLLFGLFRLLVRFTNRLVRSLASRFQ